MNAVPKTQEYNKKQQQNLCQIGYAGGAIENEWSYSGLGVKNASLRKLDHAG
jgi:hypothetical protein|tara:strand:+ start:241 stop:396 length:156 start_codon:yes stop_codon:yes gene_type:complete